MKNILKKILTIYTCAIIIICNFNYVSGEEIEESTSGTNEESEEIVSATEYDLEQDEEIEELNEQMLTITPMLATSTANTTTGDNGKMKTFDKLSTTQLNWYKSNYSSYPVIAYRSGTIYYFNNNNVGTPSYDSTNDKITFSTNWYDSLSSTGGTGHWYGLGTLTYYPNIDSSDSSYSYLRFNKTLSDYYYTLVPYTLTINTDSALGTVTNEVTAEPYATCQVYYPNQQITLIYDDSNNDFTGWYDTDGNLLSNQLTYSFNIAKNTTIVLNAKSFTTLESNIEQFRYLIIMVSFITFVLMTRERIFE